MTVILIACLVLFVVGVNLGLMAITLRVYNEELERLNQSDGSERDLEP